MEESEKRRERLRAMRVEAAAEAVPSSSSSLSQQTLISTPLANPLLENQDSTTASTPPRFDFYTDPMAAYTTNKHRPFTPRPHFSPSQCGPRNPGMPPSGVHTHQFQNYYGPHQGTYQGGDPYYSPGPTSSPMGIRSPYPVHQGSPNFSTAPGSGSPYPGPGRGGSPYLAYQGSPNFRSPPPPQGRGHWSNNTPRPSPGRGGGLSPNVGRGRGQWDGSSPSPSPGGGGGPSPNVGRGRGQWDGSSPSPSPGGGGGPSPNVGRGKGQWDGSRMSPSPRYSGGRGRGRGYGDGQSRSFYNKSMVEDPWESLTPVIWQAEKENDVRSFTNNRGFFQKAATFQKTPNAKKRRVSNPFDASNSNKGGSLADFLAESFDEAVEDASTV